MVTKGINSLLFIDHAEDLILAVLQREKKQSEKKGHFITEINVQHGLF